MNYKKYAKLAWDSYKEKVNHTNFEGNPLPVWEELGDRQKEGWEASVQAVIESALDLEAGIVIKK